MQRISLSSAAIVQIARAVRAAFPEEACGLLVGAADRVRLFRPLRNTARDRRRVRFEIAPADYRAIERAAAAKKLTVLGVFHSHPATPAVPSETDAAFIATWPDWVHVIARVDVGPKGPAMGEIRAYTGRGRKIVEVPVGVS